jgi:hypothetical protein
MIGFRFPASIGDTPPRREPAPIRIAVVFNS